MADQVDDSRPAQRIRCRVVGLTEATHDIRIIRLAPLDGTRLAFRAGQYVRATFDGQPPRDYSLASRPDESELELHIREIGAGPSRYAVRNLALDEEVELEGPHGEAWLRPGHGGPLLALGGGSGLAPMKAIVETALTQGMTRPVHLYLGIRAERDIYLEERFRVLESQHANFRFVPVLSDPDGETERRTGFVHEAVVQDFASLHGFVAYLAGPPVMVEAAVPLLQGLGVTMDDIHADPFYSDAEMRRRLGVS